MAVTIIGTTIEQEDYHHEVIICVGTKFKLTGDLTVVESDIHVGIYTLHYCHKQFMG